MKEVLSILIIITFLVINGCSNSTEPEPARTYTIKYVAECYDYIVYFDPSTHQYITTTGSGVPIYTITRKNVPSGTKLDLTVINTGYSAKATIKVNDVVKVSKTQINSVNVTYTLR